MFNGTHKHSLDDKSRIAIPSKLRQQLTKCSNSNVLMVTRGIMNCLWAFPMEEWEKLIKKAQTHQIINIPMIDFNRFFVGPAVDCNLDKMGRIMIPEVLRDYAGITKEVVISGATEKIEIWSKESYDKYWEDFNKSYIERIKQMQDIGF